MTLSCKTEIGMLTPDTQETEFTQFVLAFSLQGKVVANLQIFGLVVPKAVALI